MMKSVGDPFTNMDFMPAWIINYVHYKEWDEITYPFWNFIDATIDILISNFVPHFTGNVITYPCWDQI